MIQVAFSNVGGTEGYPPERMLKNNEKARVRRFYSQSQGLLTRGQFGSASQRDDLNRQAQSLIGQAN